MHREWSSRHPAPLTAMCLLLHYPVRFETGRSFPSWQVSIPWISFFLSDYFLTYSFTGMPVWECGLQYPALGLLSANTVVSPSIECYLFPDDSPKHSSIVGRYLMSQPTPPIQSQSLGPSLHLQTSLESWINNNSLSLPVIASYLVAKPISCSTCTKS